MLTYADVCGRMLTYAGGNAEYAVDGLTSLGQHTSAYVSIRPHTSEYVSIRQHMLRLDVSIRL